MRALAIKPESKTSLLIRSLSLYRSAFLEVFFLSLLMAIILFIPRLMTFTTINTQSNIGVFYYQQIGSVLLDIIGIMIFITILRRVYCILRGERDTVTKDFKTIIHKIPLAIASAIIQSLVIAAIAVMVFVFYYFLTKHNLYHFKNPYSIYFIMLSLVIPFFAMIYIFYLFYFYLALIVTENNGIFRSLIHSAGLVFGNWWDTFILQLTPIVAYMCFLILVKFIIGLNFHIYFADNPNHTIAATLLQILSFAIFTPWVASIIMVQLRDLELRKK